MATEGDKHLLWEEIPDVFGFRRRTEFTQNVSDGTVTVPIGTLSELWSDYTNIGNAQLQPASVAIDEGIAVGAKNVSKVLGQCLFEYDEVEKIDPEGPLLGDGEGEEEEDSDTIEIKLGWSLMLHL